jgi:hypothetical protein
MMKYIFTLIVIIFSVQAVAQKPVEDSEYLSLEDESHAQPATDELPLKEPEPVVVEGNENVVPLEPSPVAAPVTPTEPVAPATEPLNTEDITNTGEIMDDIIEDSAEADAEPAPDLFDGKNFDTLNLDFKTLLFNREQVDIFHDSLAKGKMAGKIVEVVEGVGEDISELAGVEEEKKIEAKTFYLASILYPKDKKWTIWVNNERIRDKQESAEITVVEVTENSVVFEFASDKMADYIEGYQQLILGVGENQEADWNYVSKDGNVKLSSQGLVRFKLKPNQTFVLKDISITEGKVGVAEAVAVPAPVNTEGGSPAGEPTAPDETPEAKEDDKNLSLMEATKGVIEKMTPNLPAVAPEYIETPNGTGGTAPQPAPAQPK